MFGSQDIIPGLLLSLLLLAGMTPPAGALQAPAEGAASTYYVDASRMDGMVAWYPFDEGSGSELDDASPYNHAGDVSGDLDYSEDVPAAIQFDNPLAAIFNGGDHVVIADAPMLNPSTEMTIAVWLHSTSPVAQASKVVGKVPAALNAGYLLGITQGQLDVEVWGQSGHVRITAGDLGDDWVHAALTYQASGLLRAYINGTEVGQAPAAGLIQSSNQVLLIGAAPWNTSSYRYNGDMDDLRLYNRALSAVEIAELASGADHGGQSWAEAFTSLQRALTSAEAGDEIWVAGGIYSPTLAPGAPLPGRETFRIPPGTALYGGFAGNETGLSQRDWRVNRSVLSGDLDRDDLADIKGIVTDPDRIAGINAYHVVTISEVDAPTVLDGFSITAGAADDFELADAHGAGLYIKANTVETPDISLRHLIIQGNRALGAGGGIYYQGSSPDTAASPELFDLTFIQNSAGSGGGIAVIDASRIVLVNTSFLGNQADQGGAVFAKSPLEFQNGVFSGNHARAGGAIFGDSAAGMQLTNVTCSGNFAAEAGGCVHLQETNAGIGNSVLWENTDASGTGQAAQISMEAAAVEVTYSLVTGALYPGAGNLNADPHFVRPPDPGDDDWSTPADNDYGDLHLRADSPAVDQGSLTLLPADDFDVNQNGNTSELLPVDRDEHPRIVYAQPDMGAFEFQQAQNTFLPLIQH